MTKPSDYSPDFYRRHAEQFADASPRFLDAHYKNSTHPKLRSDEDIIGRFRQLITAYAKGLDAGCGAGARDVFLYWQAGYDVYGIDVIEENIEVAVKLHPEIAERVYVADVSRSLEFPDALFDFVLCNCVIQHLSPEVVTDVTFPEFARVLKRNGVMQLTFKVGSGIVSAYDSDYDTDRTFLLYEVEWVVALLQSNGLEVIAGDGYELGGIVLYDDPKPMRHCLLYARKSG